MSEENTEDCEGTFDTPIVVSSTEEDFINTLKTIRAAHKSDEQEELQNLAKRLSVLKQRLDEAKVSIKRESAFNELLLIEKIMHTTAPLFSIEDMELRASAKSLTMDLLSTLKTIHKREFSKE